MGLWNNVPVMAESRKQLISKPFRKNEMAIKKAGYKKVRIIEPRPTKTDLKAGPPTAFRISLCSLFTGLLFLIFFAWGYFL